MSGIICYENVDICYNGSPVIKKVSFSAEKGEILGIAGESGSGKSTLIKAAIGLLGKNGSVTGGKIWYEEKNLLDLNAKELRKICGSEIGMIFQNAGSSFCPIRTVGEQLLEEMKEHRKIKKAEFEDEAAEMLAKFGFQDPKRILKSYPFELSGGMQQRVGVAAAMLLKPKILLADEPTSALDVSIQKQVVEQMKMIREQYGTTILIVTHNIGVIRAMADSMLVLKDGKMEEYGKTQEVLSHPQSDYTKRLLAAIPVLRRENMEPLLQISHLTKIFSDGKEDEYKAVDDVSFELFPGEKLAIIGESGSGKTTVVNMITRILDSTDGKILLDGEDITHYKRNKMKNIYRKMQMVFQTPTESFDPRCRLGDAVAESLRNAGMPKKEAMEIVKELFKQCGLPEDFMKRYPHEVSGGQCQRAAIARAIAIKPRLLILDEATSALDVTVQAEILQLLDALQEERQMSYLFICHDIALVQNFCDRVLVMYQGKIVEQGKTEEVLHFPKHEYTRMLLDSVL